MTILDDNNKEVVVTGCAGFIGSHLTDSLLGLGYRVKGIDNLRTGKKKFLEKALLNPNFSFIETDLFSFKNAKKVIDDCSRVYHLSANADVRFGPDNPRIDLEQNVIVTHNILEAMRENSINEIIFSSTGSIYGESTVIPTPELAPFPTQTSLYGASKLACEGLISAYVESFNMKAWIFRFVSILGPRYTHGHVFDFYKQLKTNNLKLVVLGNGEQRKSYLHVFDCISGIHCGVRNAKNKLNILNLGTNGYCKIKESIGWICEELRVNPEVLYGDEEKGWVGDNPYIYLDTSKIRALGWVPENTIEDGVKETVKYFKENSWLFNNE